MLALRAERVISSYRRNRASIITSRAAPTTSRPAVKIERPLNETSAVTTFSSPG
jgi:hypothetical protein